MIQLNSITKAYGDRVLFNQVTWQIPDRERVGLCGPNGAGKTTLLKMFAGLEEPDLGTIIKPAALQVGYLPQDGLTHQGRTVYEETSLAFQELLDVKAEMHALEERLGDATIPEAEHEQLLARYSDLQDRFRVHDGYSIDLKIAAVLRGLGFSQDDLERPTETFSGGWQMRIALAKLLLARPNLLLLDEPTNHLDLEARNWLEEYLRDYPHAVILVSHDRFFLDAVVNRITEVNLRKLTDYFGGYTHYLAERGAELDRLREAKRRQDEEVARMRQFIDRFRYQATKAAQVQSRIKMLEKVTPIEVPPERKRVHFTFPACHKSGRMVLELQHVSKAYGSTRVFRDVTLHFERGDRIALVGPNGTGKSTLMRLLSGVDTPDSGARREGHQLVMQYFAQDEATRLDPRLTVYETLASGSPNHMVPAIRNILGGFLFSGDDVYKPVAVLSGGERTRLAVARMLLRPSNALLLDEPTNHLDIDSKDVLLDALVDFGGTLIFVSHDRYFVDRLATKVIEIGGGDAALYPGTYEEFLWKKEHPGETGERREARGEREKKEDLRKGEGSKTGERSTERRKDAKAPAAAQQHDARKRASAEAKKQGRENRALKERIASLEARIAELERAMKEIETAMATPGFYDDHDAARPIVDRHQALMWEVGDLMHEWEELSTLASRLSSLA
jgi:ATP-binding cassette subfamily F protein 3